MNLDVGAGGPPRKCFAWAFVLHRRRACAPGEALLHARCRPRRGRQITACGRGGIGRRAALRSLWGNPWKFESSRPHQPCSKRLTYCHFSFEHRTCYQGVDRNFNSDLSIIDIAPFAAFVDRSERLALRFPANRRSPPSYCTHGRARVAPISRRCVLTFPRPPADNASRKSLPKETFGNDFREACRQAGVEILRTASGKSAQRVRQMLVQRWLNWRPFSVGREAEWPRCTLALPIDEGCRKGRCRRWTRTLCELSIPAPR